MYPFGRPQEIQRVVRVLGDTRPHGEDIRVEDDVLGCKPHLLGQQAEGPLADTDTMVVVGGLPVLIKAHHDDRCAQPIDLPRLLQEHLLALLERERVDDTFPLQTF